MTKAETRFQKDVRDLGCIVCRIILCVYSPCEIHHILKDNERISELDVLGLCQNHHRAGVNNKRFVSRHPWKRSFEERYGTEEFLLEVTKEGIKIAGRQNVMTIPEER